MRFLTLFGWTQTQDFGEREYVAERAQGRGSPQPLGSSLEKQIFPII